MSRTRLNALENRFTSFLKQGENPWPRDCEECFDGEAPLDVTCAIIKQQKIEFLQLLKNTTKKVSLIPIYCNSKADLHRMLMSIMKCYNIIGLDVQESFRRFQYNMNKCNNKTDLSWLRKDKCTQTDGNNENVAENNSNDNRKEVDLNKSKRICLSLKQIKTPELTQDSMFFKKGGENVGMYIVKLLFVFTLNFVYRYL